MPIYEYECGSCGLVFDRFFSMAGMKDKVACESCGQKARHKFSVPALMTDTNNPYQKFKHAVTFDVSTRKSAEDGMDRAGLVMANGADAEVMKRRAETRKRERKSEIAALTREYAKIPLEVRKASLALEPKE